MVRKLLLKKDAWAIRDAWQAVFARRLHRLTGKWIRGRDRDVFRPDFMVKYLKGVEAEVEYALVRAPSVYVLSDDGERVELRQCEGGEMPTIAEFVEKYGVLIFPPDFAWTLAVGADYSDRVTFAYREWVDDVYGDDDSL